MAIDLYTIARGKGIGPFSFGQAPREIESVLGAPDDKILDEGGLGSETWIYYEPQLALSFHQHESYRLTSFETEHPWATLSGVRFVGMSQLAAEAALATLGIEHSFIAEAEEERFESTAGDLTLWLEYGQVASVQCSSLETEAPP